MRMLLDFRSRCRSWAEWRYLSTLANWYAMNLRWVPPRTLWLNKMMGTLLSNAGQFRPIRIPYRDPFHCETWGLSVDSQCWGDPVDGEQSLPDRYAEHLLRFGKHRKLSWGRTLCLCVSELLSRRAHRPHYPRTIWRRKEPVYDSLFLCSLYLNRTNRSRQRTFSTE